MSESMKCDNCQVTGRRRRGSYCPEGWYYAVSADDCGNEYYILSVCSDHCRDTIWEVGPGRFTLEEMLNPTTPTPMEQSRPEELLQALEDTMTKRELTSMKIDLVNGKWLVMSQSKSGEDYLGCNESIVEAFKEAFKHQDEINGQEEG